MAWNSIDRPVVDLLVITGSRAVRYQHLAAAAMPAGTMLTPSRLGLARRRLADIPALRQARASYRTVAGGLVEVRAAVLERPTLDPLWRLVAAGALGGLTRETAGLEVASPTGAGELWVAEWRWAAVHSRAAVSVELPARLGIPGVVGVEGAWERTRVAPDAESTLVAEDTWRSASIGFGAWVTPGVRPSVKVGLQRWSGDRRYLTLAAGTVFSGPSDRFRVTATAVQAEALSAHASYRSGAVRAFWASSLGLGRPAWSARFGADWVGAHAPLGNWPVVGTDPSRAIPLRAEPSPLADVLAGRAIGRAIVHGGLAGDVPVYRWGPLVLAAGAFVDGARISAPPDDSGGRLYVDAGVGIRIGLAGGGRDILHIDLARRIVAGRGTALTMGVHRPWSFLGLHR